MLWVLTKKEWMLIIKIYKSKTYIRQLSLINKSRDSLEKLQYNHHIISLENVALWNQFRWANDLGIIIKLKAIKIEMGATVILKLIIQK